LNENLSLKKEMEKMKYKKIKPNKDEEYEIAYDDKCLIVKCGKLRVWISKAMAKWIASNFAK